MSTRLERCAPTATKTASKAALLALGDQVLDLVPAGHPHAHRRDPVELTREHVAGQPVGRDAVPHHPARLLAGVPDLHLVAEPAQMVGGRQTARPGADHEHPLAAADRGRVELPPLLEREVAQEPLDRMDRDGAVEVGAVADALARVVADPPVDRGQRIVRDELTPGLLVPARLGMRQPGLDVLARRAARIARRQQIDVDRSALSDRARVRTARAAGPAAASRPASGRSCLSPRSNAITPRLTGCGGLPTMGGTGLEPCPVRLGRSCRWPAPRSCRRFRKRSLRHENSTATRTSGAVGLTRW